MSELKRCPFCESDRLKIESKTTHVSYRHVYKYSMSVRCNKCHARGGTVSGEVGDYAFGTPESKKLTTVKELEEKAIEAWNTRKPTERIVERLEVMQDNLPAELSHCHEFYVEGMFEGLNRGIEIVKEEGLN